VTLPRSTQSDTRPDAHRAAYPDAPLIDLHLHTTASDGRLSPPALVARVAAAGVTVMAVTDHDTTAATNDVREAARGSGVEAISGIEITAVEQRRDVHVLGYFVDASDADLAAFLEGQRARRLTRVEAIAARLAALGFPMDVSDILESARREQGRAIGRPQLARAMVAAGYVRDTNEAFDGWLAHGRPAFVPREGATVAEVIAVIHTAGGLASLAHPAKTGFDESIPAFRDAGLDALEAFHSDHDATTQQRYAALARELGMLTTGGSDFHGDPAHGLEPGASPLPVEEWQRFVAARPGA
jgi:predicted metal-dependent phosphoesterase TrpH